MNKLDGNDICYIVSMICLTVIIIVGVFTGKL